MDSKQKQRAVIEFLTKEGCKLSDIHRRLQNVYGDDTIDKSNVHRSMKKFREGKPALKTNRAVYLQCLSQMSSVGGRPDLAPSDFYLFGPMKDSLRGQRFDNTDEVKVAVKKWIRQCRPDFFQRGFESWVE